MNTYGNYSFSIDLIDLIEFIDLVDFLSGLGDVLADVDAVLADLNDFLNDVSFIYYLIIRRSQNGRRGRGETSSKR